MSRKCDCSWCDSSEHKDFHGYQIGDDAEVRHKKRGKAKAKKHFKGCPENGRKAHIYVWIEYFGKEWQYRAANVWAMQKVDVHWYDKICIGCGHRNNRRYDWGFRYRRANDGNGIDVYEVRHVDYSPTW